MYLVLRTETFAKLFFLISCTGLFMYAILAFYTFHTAYTTISEVQKPQELKINSPSVDYVLTNDIELDNDLKYILFWTQSYNDPAVTIPEGQNVFTDHRCDYANCFVTTNKTLIKNDYTNFDAIVFNISVLKNWKKLNMPQRRSRKQKYVFHSIKPSDDTPICNIKADNYFNWTWTYKLNSDIVSPLIEVTDLQGNIVAPKLNVDWSTNESIVMEDKINTNIKPKRKALALIMEKCNFKNKRAGFLKELQAELKFNLLEFDIYGCDNIPCPQADCSHVIQNYYFYLVYEDNIAEDFMSREVLKAYNHGAIPVIYGRADYQKFLPQGSYIKVHSMSVDHITIKIAYIIRNPYVYYSHFNWKKRYSIHETEDLKGICDLCANLNDHIKLRNFSAYKNFRKWWYHGSLYEKCIPKSAENLAEVLAYINNTDKSI